MPSAAMIAEANKKRSTSAWFWLYDIELQTNATESRWLSLAGTDEDVTYRGRTYLAFPVTHGDLESTGGGSIPSADLTVSNIGGAAAELLRTYGGLEDRRVRIRYVHETLVSLDIDTIAHDTRIVAAAVRNDVVVLKLGEPPLHSLNFPGRNFGRLTCGYPFRSPRCGWVSGQGGDEDSCDFGLDTSNGCASHSNTARFGGFASLPGGR